MQFKKRQKDEVDLQEIKRTGQYFYVLIFLLFNGGVNIVIYLSYKWQSSETGSKKSITNYSTSGIKHTMQMILLYIK